jgi:hypothetical protein
MRLLVHACNQTAANQKHTHLLHKAVRESLPGQPPLFFVLVLVVVLVLDWIPHVFQFH